MSRFGWLFLFFVMLCCDVNAQDVQLEKLPLNSNYSNEIAPFYHDSILYFSSNRRKSFFVTYFNQSGEKLYHLYQVRQTSDGKWVKPQLFDERYQSPFNNASVSINEAGNLMVISHGRADDLQGVKKSRNGDLLGLYQVKYNGKGWGKSTLLPFSKVRDYSLTHASLSPDGRYLFYVSDAPNGEGKSDIYMCENSNGEWSEPANLGKPINTPGNELFPFYHASGDRKSVV